MILRLSKGVRYDAKIVARVLSGPSGGFSSKYLFRLSAFLVGGLLHRAVIEYPSQGGP